MDDPLDDPLRTGDEYFRAFFELNAFGAAQTDPRCGRFRRVNDAYCQITGYGRDELLTMRFSDLTHPDDRAADVAEYRRLVQGEIPVKRLEKRYVRKDGRVVWVQVDATVVRDAAGCPLSTLAVVQDVTERCQAREALRSSEERFRAVVESQSDLVVRYLPDTTRTFVNDAYCRFFGKARDELIGHKIVDLIPDPESRAEFLSHVESMRRHPRREVFEHVVEAPTGEMRWLHWADHAEFDAAGNLLEFQGIGRDVTARRLAEDRLRESEARNRALLDAIPDMMFLQSADGVYLDFHTPNPDDLLVPPEHFLGKRTRDVFPPELADTFARCHALVRETGDPQAVEYSLPMRGESRYFDARIVSCEGDKILSIVRDITERKRTEAALREAEARYRTLVEQVPTVVFMETLGDGAGLGELVYVSPQVEALLGYPVESWLTEPELWERSLHPDDRERTLAIVGHAYESGQPYTAEFRLIARDGHTVWVRDETQLVRDADGRPLHWQGVTIDVTAERLAAEALREAEAKYRARVEEVPAISYVQSVDPPHPITYISPQFEKILGWAPEEVLADPAYWVTLLHPDDRERALAAEANSHATGEPFDLEYRQRTRDGGYVWLYDRATLMRDAAGHPRYWQGIAIDVTARKVIEARLHESEERFRAAFDYAPIGMALVAPDGRFLQVNRALCRILGYDERELLATTCPAITHPDDVAADADQLRRVLAGERRDYQLEKRYVHKDGRIVWVLASIALVQAGCGDSVSFVCQIEDITERRRADAALREAEARYHTLVEQIPAVVYTGGPADDRAHADLRYISPQIEQLLGYPVEEWIADPDLWQQAIHPDDRARTLSEVSQTGTRDEPSVTEYRLIGRDGRVVWVRDEAKLVRSDDGRPLHWQGIAVDISAHRQAEAAARAADERYRGLIRDLHVGVVVHGPDAQILISNQAALDMLGLTEEELVGTIPPALDWRVVHEDGSPFPRHNRPVALAIASREPVRGTVLGVDRPRTLDRAWLLVNTMPQFGPDGAVTTRTSQPSLRSFTIPRPKPRPWAAAVVPWMFRISRRGTRRKAKSIFLRTVRSAIPRQETSLALRPAFRDCRCFNACSIRQVAVRRLPRRKYRNAPVR